MNRLLIIIKGLDRKLVTFSKFMDAESHKPIGDYMQTAFIQLPAFDNLTHMSTMETMAFTSHQDIFNRLAKVANLATLTPAERMQYDYDLKKARDYHAEMNFARNKAYTQGREEGKEEGREKAILETAHNLKALGASIDMIARATGLSKAQIEAL